MSCWRLTDKQLIERIRRQHRARRGLGVLVLVIAAIALCTVGWYTDRLWRQGLELMHELRITEHPTDEQLADVHTTNTFVTGFVLGGIIAQATLAGGLLLCIGVGLVIGKNRPNRMLLDLWDRTHGAGGDEPTPVDAAGQPR